MYPAIGQFSTGEKFGTVAMRSYSHDFNMQSRHFKGVTLMNAEIVNNKFSGWAFKAACANISKL